MWGKVFSCDSIPKPLLSTLLDQVKHNAAELTETTHFNCEAVGSFALRHPSAQDEVGGPAQASQVVGEQDGVLCLGAHLVKKQPYILEFNLVLTIIRKNCSLVGQTSPSPGK